MPICGLPLFIYFSPNFAAKGKSFAGRAEGGAAGRCPARRAGEDAPGAGEDAPARRGALKRGEPYSEGRAEGSSARCC